MTIWTSGWTCKIPAGHTWVSISRSAPRSASGYKKYSKLAPGKWFNSVSIPEYNRLYDEEILGKLDPKRVVEELEAMGPNPTLLCWEKPSQIDAGKCFCHRHTVAQWLEDKLGIVVAEIGFPSLKRFAFLRCQHTPAPSYGPRAPEDLLDLMGEKAPWE